MPPNIAIFVLTSKTVFSVAAGCPKAIHTVYLDSGGCEAPYLAQLQTLHNVRNFIHASLRSELVEFNAWPSLKLQHRVFTRVSDILLDEPKVTYNVAYVV